MLAAVGARVVGVDVARRSSRGYLERSRGARIVPTQRRRPRAAARVLPAREVRLRDRLRAQQPARLGRDPAARLSLAAACRMPTMSRVRRARRAPHARGHASAPLRQARLAPRRATACTFAVWAPNAAAVVGDRRLQRLEAGRDAAALLPEHRRRVARPRRRRRARRAVQVPHHVAAARLPASRRPIRSRVRKRAAQPGTASIVWHDRVRVAATPRGCASARRARSPDAPMSIYEVPPRLVAARRGRTGC